MQPLKFFLIVLSALLCFSLSAAQDVPPPGSAYVVNMGSTLRLRAQPSTDAAILSHLLPYTPLVILGQSESGRWLQVSTPQGMGGWVMAEYVDVSQASAPNTTNAAAQPNVPFNAYGLIGNITENARQIHRQGRQLGVRPNVFSKVGDSITAAPQNLSPIGFGQYDLGDYTFLQPVIDYYSGTFARDHNSFANGSLAALSGWTTSSVLNVSNGNFNLCQRDETPIACELRQVRPALAFIMLGTNDMTALDTNTYRNNLIEIAKTAIRNGTVPILSTIPPRNDYPGALARTDEMNGVIRQIALELDIPLIDYHSAMLTLPNYGLELDNVHPNSAYLGLRGAADFRANNLIYGYVMRNLIQLHALDRLWREVIQAP